MRQGRTMKGLAYALMVHILANAAMVACRLKVSEKLPVPQHKFPFLVLYI